MRADTPPGGDKAGPVRMTEREWRIKQWQQLDPPFPFLRAGYNRKAAGTVAKRFRGESVHKVDGKGRVSIPAAFRRVLEENDPDWHDGLNPNLVIVYGGKSRPFLEGFSMVAMDEVDERIAELPRGTKNRRLLERMFSGQAVPLQVDETGRLVLSPKLRDKIGITSEAFFIAAGDTFQIWQPQAYDAQADRLEDIIEDFDVDFDPLTLLDAETQV